MNAVEIEQAVSELAEQPFDAAEFAFAFLRAFGNKDTTIKRLRNGESNKSDLGGVLQTNHIHIKVTEPGDVAATAEALKASPATKRFKARFVLATDGVELYAEDVTSDEAPVICAFTDFPNHFGAFLALAGISTVKQVRESTFDIRATSRLNRLYIELLKDNPEWGTAARRPDMNHFMARLIFCFFAEDTDIFNGKRLFTATVEQMTERDGSDTNAVISAIFTAMNTTTQHEGAPDGRYRREAGLRPWADAFPYVNGGLFSGNTDVPRFSRIARSYLINIGSLDWTRINPDIFGSMIQAVADDEERGALGMHYTSVPNILKVLDPLFLDDLREKLEDAGDNARKLLNLRNRMARIRVFDPACGSGNFLVIAYKEMREIEAAINQRRGEQGRSCDIPLTNFRGIELRHFPAEIARLALIIAEYQADVVYRGQKEALAAFLPLDQENWIVQGNALRLDWSSICRPSGIEVEHSSQDLLDALIDQPEVDFKNDGGETYICGNPPYLGGKGQSEGQKFDLSAVFDVKQNIGELDYVSGWLLKAAVYCSRHDSRAAFVVTNSLNQGSQVHQLWPRIFELGLSIDFAYKDFKWANNASNNAAVICSIIGIAKLSSKIKRIYSGEIYKEVANIAPYLVAGDDTIVDQRLSPPAGLSPMITGNSPYDGGNLILSTEEKDQLIRSYPEAVSLIKRLYGSRDYLNGEQRFCLWIDDSNIALALAIGEVTERIERVRTSRIAGGEVARALVARPHQFRYTHTAARSLIIAPRVSSERRQYIPFGLLSANSVIGDSAQAIYDAEIWHLSILLSLVHMVWVKALAGRLKTDLRYSSGLCYNTFPVPPLTERNKADLTRCAEDILLAREAHFPATIADLYDPEAMPADLRAAHERNDEVLERIYIGRRFRNDTERLEKLFELYTKMVANDAATPKPKRKSKA